MRRLLVVPLLVAATAAAPPAARAEPGPGNACGYSSVSDPTHDVRQQGWVDGGPLALDSVLADAAGRTGRLVCTVQVDGVRHSDADAARAESETTPAVVVLPPTPVTYDAPADAWVVTLCTEVHVDGVGTFYWDFPNESWSTDPDVECHGPSAPEPWPPTAELFEEVVDPLACQFLVLVAPPEGDVDGFWDCPPYEW